MNRYILFIFLFAIEAGAQVPEHRRDTFLFPAWESTVLRVPVLRGETQPQIIVPQQSDLCFNIEMDFELHVGSRTVDQCMFINTEKGITGYLPPSSNGLVNVLLPEIPTFDFTVNSMKGNLFHYFNRKGKHDVIDHWVSTGNTDISLTQKGQAVLFDGAGVLARKTETAEYCGANMRATAYRLETGNTSTTWFIYSDHYPQKLHAKEFLGHFGVGYLKTEEGLFLIMEMRSTSVTTKITNIANVHPCFNASIFRKQEEEANRNVNADLQTERDKIARDEAAINGDCQGEKRALIDFRRRAVSIQEQNLRNSQHGNVYQDSITQRGYLDRNNPDLMVEQGMLQNKLNGCLLQKSLEKARDNTERQRIQDKISCLNQQYAQLQNLQTQLNRIDQQYAGNLARIHAEKSALLMRIMSVSGCN